MEEKSKKGAADKLHAKVQLTGGPFNGMKVRHYPENMKEVRTGQQTPIYADLILDGERYEATTVRGTRGRGIKPGLVYRGLVHRPEGDH